MKFLIADDHAMVRHGLGILLTRLFDGVTIVEAADTDAVLAQLNDASDLDIILLDLMMPGMDGQKGLQRVIERAPHVPVAIISASEDADDVGAAIRKGAKGYILKASDEVVLKLAISLILSGEIYIPSRYLTLGPDRLHRRGARKSDVVSLSNPLSELTKREASVLRLLMQGQSNKEIARNLDLLEGTVKKSVWHIFRKLGVTSRTQAVIAANKLGWPEPTGQVAAQGGGHL